MYVKSLYLNGKFTSIVGVCFELLQLIQLKMLEELLVHIWNVVVVLVYSVVLVPNSEFLLSTYFHWFLELMVLLNQIYFVWFDVQQFQALNVLHAQQM